MADIELVIKIPDEYYENLLKNCRFSSEEIPIVSLAIAIGKPIPKGHKRLIEDNFEVGPIFDKDGNRIGYKYVTQEDLNNAPTIIEADKENN